MTPEQKFARWVRVSIASFLLMFVYFIVADIWIPLTPDSTVMRVVTPVSARVSGYVAAVHVHNNSQVKKGDLLFELDATPFRNKVEAAQIALEQARLSNDQLDAQIAAAQASLKTAVLTARNDKVTFDRYQKLSTLQNVSQADLDKVRTTWQSSEQSVSSIQANIHNLRIQRRFLRLVRFGSAGAGEHPDRYRGGFPREEPAAYPPGDRRRRGVRRLPGASFPCPRHQQRRGDPRRTGGRKRSTF